MCDQNAIEKTGLTAGFFMAIFFYGLFFAVFC